MNARDKDGETPLHKAAFLNKNPAVITALLKAGAGVNARDKYGDTPLHKAVSNIQNPAVVTALLNAGADVSARNKPGKTPPQSAMERRKKTPAIVNVLNRALEREKRRGAERRLRAKSCVKWNTEAFFEHADTSDVSRCLKTKSPNVRNTQGETPLHKAVAYNKIPAVVSALLKAGAGVNAKDVYGNTPLHEAASWNKNPAAITALVKAGAEVNAKDEFGETPLHKAASRNKNPAVITTFVAYGADPNARGGYAKNTPLEIARGKNKPALVAAFSAEAVAVFREKERKARAAARMRRMERRLRSARVSCEKWNTSGFFIKATGKDVSRCLKTGADLKTRNEQGRTPLHTAAVFSRTPEVVSVLINAGADLNAKDKRGRTPLQFAKKFSKTPAVVSILRKASTSKKARVVARKREVKQRPGAARVSCEKWNTPAFFRSAGKADLARCLKVKDPNVRNKNGRTPLHYAAQGEEPALVTALVKAGADPNARDARGGWTPLHLAAWFGKTPTVVAALLAAGADPAVRDMAGKTPWDYAEQNPALKDTAPYWRLNEERVR